MRFGLKKYVVAAALVAFSLPGLAHANASNAKTLAQVEKQGLRGVGNKRLQSMTEVSAAPAGSVQFTANWVAQQPKATGGPEFRCLTEALYFEARGETVKGQFAVAEVIQNRVKSSRFPSSFCGVINQGTGKKYQCQFTYTCDGHAEVVSEPAAYARVAKIARAVIDGRAPDIVDGATFYHTTAVRPRWASKFTRTAKIGVHLFYRRGVRTASN